MLERREFLNLGAGMAVASGMNPSPQGKIVIVGGGIIGASICYRLAIRGANVTLLERDRPAAGATRGSFAWINASFTKQPRHYNDLNRLGLYAFRALHQELGPELPAIWSGTIEWYANRERADELRRMAELQRGWGYPVRLLDDRERRLLEPRVAMERDATSTFAEIEGHVDAVGTTRLLLRRARAAGARVLYPCEVENITASGDRYKLKTSQGEFDADTLVLACGTATQRMAAMAGVESPLIPAPGIVIGTPPQPELIRHIMVTEEAHFRRNPDGRFLIGDDYGPPSSAIHQQLAAHPLDFPNPGYARLHGERIRSKAARYLPALKSAPIERVTICWRPMPKDGFPIVGFAGNGEEKRRLYIAVTHSGVTLGPLIGQLAALEILDGAKVDLLAPYRPTRF